MSRRFWSFILGYVIDYEDVDTGVTRPNFELKECINEKLNNLNH
jgi:hypothetical protein